MMVAATTGTPSGFVWVVLQIDDAAFAVGVCTSVIVDAGGDLGTELYGMRKGGRGVSSIRTSPSSWPLLFGVHWRRSLSCVE
jgi:hypothetical protein